jgi:DUF4097 and DUF4098 domain-containing protein YvlB
MNVDKARCICALFGLSATLFFTSGCVIVVSTGCDWDRSPEAWTEETVELPIDSAGLTALEVRTHNGAIEFTGQSGGAAGSITIRKKAGGSSTADAQEAMAAIEIVSERSAGGEHKLAWRWKGDKKSRWVAAVTFAIHASGALRFDAQTHNGSVTASAVTGDAKLVTQNGKITVDSRDGKLHARTHNGSISATYSGPSVTLETHNGAIKADLRQSGSVRGDVTTHNGAIELSVGAGTAAELVAETVNGRVTCDAPITVGSVEKSRLEGKLGQGGDRLELTTHNGSISIKAAG